MLILIAFALVLKLASASCRCRHNEFLYVDICLKSCPSDTYIYQNGQTKQCRTCDIKKLLILDKERNQCVCSGGTFYDQYSKQCIQCHYSCMTCKGAGVNQCLTCDVNRNITKRYMKQGSCLCPSGYFDDDKLKDSTCKKCHTDCLTCNGPRQIDCIRCAFNRYRVKQGYCFCNLGYMEDQNGTCVCPYPFKIQNSICRSLNDRCGYGEEAIQRQSTRIGVVGSSYECRCKYGFDRIKGVCKACKQNQQYNQIKQICQCLPPGIQYKGRCIKCGQNKIFNKTLGICHCTKNFQQTEKQECIVCPPNQIYRQGQCRCIFNYYKIQKQDRCRRCTIGEHLNCLHVHYLEPQRQLTLAEITPQK